MFFNLKPLYWQIQLFILIMLLHGIAVAAIFWHGQHKDMVILPTLQGVLVEKVSQENVPPKEINLEPPPKPVEKPKPKKPVEKKPEPKESDFVIEQPAPDESEAEEIAEEITEDTVTETEPPLQQAVASTPPAAAPVKMPDANAAHLQNPAPVYPVLSRKLKEQGTVVLNLLVLASGQVGDVKLEKSSGYPRLDDSAMQAVKHWHYVPAVKNGTAIDYWHIQPVIFTLN